MLLIYSVIILFIGTSAFVHKVPVPRFTTKLLETENIGPDPTAVKEVVSNILDALIEKAGIKVDFENEKDIDEKIASNLDDLENSYQKILSAIRSSTISTNDKINLLADANIVIDDVKQGGRLSKNTLDCDVIKTSMYSASVSPVVLVHGPGICGQKCLDIVKTLGKAADIRLINGEFLGTMQDSEINYALRSAKSIIIAADEKATEEKGSWFGGASVGVEVKQTINEKSLKRLLNAAMKESQKEGTKMKVVFLENACKEKKGIASLLSGDTTDLSSEVILQCNQRGLSYAIVKVGKIIADNQDVPSNARVRDTGGGNSPMVFSNSKIFESTECTRLSIVSEALFRSASHPQTNSTITVLSTKAPQRDISDIEWNDEFLKIVGPELERIPLIFTGEKQISLRLGLIAENLMQPGSGLITPIEIERFSNGIKILFKPKAAGGYVSSKEERKQIASVEPKLSVNTVEPKSRGAYVSPEEERRQAQQVLASSKEPPSTQVKKKINRKLEGGLEIYVDSVPTRRVRIRRCNMDTDTIVKEESEALILRSILKGIQTLENDYRVLTAKASAALK